jgi:hypothetical protein
MPVNADRPAGGLTSLWTAAGFFYNMIVIEMSVFVQNVNHRLL